MQPAAVNVSATVNLTLAKEPSETWGSACGGPLELELQLLEGVVADAGGRMNGPSNIL